MEAWSNIEVSPEDPEIIQINDLESKLGRLPDKARKIRELITGFEVCHFKYQRHVKKIIESIVNLEPKEELAKIGANHIRHGQHVLENDQTGRSLLGLQYIWGIRRWLVEDNPNDISVNHDEKLEIEILQWLGDKNSHKIRLVKLLLARMTWDWESYEKLKLGSEFKEIEEQASRIDICHYAFPVNLELLLQSIGQMKPVTEKHFAGCGSWDNQREECIKEDFLKLNDELESLILKEEKDRNDFIRIWLTACFIKTLKESVHLSLSMTNL